MIQRANVALLSTKKKRVINQMLTTLNCLIMFTLSIVAVAFHLSEVAREADYLAGVTKFIVIP